MLKMVAAMWLAAWLTCACSQAPEQPSPAQISVAESARPADPELSKIYQRSCISCHTAPASTAPLVGFEAAWEPRLKQGMPTLVLHAKNGFKAMPPKGLCSDCGDLDLQKLIEFMAAPRLPMKDKAS